MASASAICIFLLSALLVLHFGYGINAGAIINEQRNSAEKEFDDSQKVTNIQQKTKKADMDPTYNVFFKFKDLHKGYTMPVYFTKKDPVNSPQLLHREQSDSIPFSSSQLDYILSLFAISKDTPQAKAMEHTLKQCEMRPKGDEIMTCVSSSESMLDLIHNVFGPNTKFETFNSITHPSETTPLLQNYTFLEAPQELPAHKMAACHPMPYPYAVFYCHAHVNGAARVFKLPIGGENGDKVDAVAVCHMDTRSWDKSHASFKVLDMKPGSGPVCHFIPPDNYVWLPSVSVD